MPKKRPRKEPTRDHAAFVVLSLSNPKDPQHCGTCLYAALLLATHGTEDHPSKPNNIPGSLRKKVEFWNTLYLFIFEPRTDEKLENLLQRLAQCSCPTSDQWIQRLHAAGKVAEEDVILRNSTMVFAAKDKQFLYTNERIAFITKAFTILEAGLTDSGVKSVAKGPLETWPTTPLDLVPFGADSLVHTLLQWYRFIPDPVIFTLTGRITHVCRFVLIPSLAKYQFSPQVIQRGKEEVEALEPHLRSAPQDTPHTRLLFQRFNWYISNFLYYFRVIYEDLPQDTRAKILAGCETKAMQLFSLLVYVATNPYLRSKSDNLTCARYCQDLFRFFHMHLYPHPNYPVHPSVGRIDSVFPPPPSVRSVPNSAACAIVEFHQETRCCAYGCPGSIQSAGNNFQRCSRCQIVSYCGRECQTRAWRDEKFPHKRVCPIIRLLVETAGGLDMFVNRPTQNLKLKLPGGPHALTPIVIQNWEAAKVDRDLIQYVHDWTRWVTTHPDRNMPDGSWWNPGFEDYDEMIQRMGGPSLFMNRLARWPSEEAQIRATLEQLPFCQQEFDRFTEPMPRGL